MPIEIGTRLGHYEVVSALGAGGMGEVYQAIDRRLDRTVAIKVLPTQLASNTDLRARFEREAKVISGLQHPNICVLFDVGEQDGVAFLVMEYLEGETLATRLQRKPLSVDEVLSIGVEMADALDKAHKQGIVHRDLKPGNVMLTKGGAKLMDFGLAKPAAFAASSGSAPSFTAAATMTNPHSPITVAGSVVGTVQYMSPEQVQGQEVDARSDIFSFGSMFYEMVTGKRAFEGKSQLSVASAILEKEPEPISVAQPLSPPALEHVVRTCLAKDPADRWQSAADLKRELIWIQEGGSKLGLPTVVMQSRKWRERALWAAALLLALLAVPAAYWFSRPAPAQMVKTSIIFPEGTVLGRAGSFAISPDGKRLAIVAQSKGGRYQLHVRALDSLEILPIANTEDAYYPFWSADSQSIAFFASGKLKKVDASGGTVQTLCDAEDGRGGTWNEEGIILFAPKPDSGLWRVSSAGGTASEFLKPPSPSQTLRWPVFLPDGEHFLYFLTDIGATTAASDTGIYVSSLSKSAPRVVLREFSDGRYANGYLLFVRDLNLMAQPFDLSSFELKGEAVPIVEKLDFNLPRIISAVTVSHSGYMVYSSKEGQSQSQWNWYDTEGRITSKVGQEATFTNASVSPDGNRILFANLDPKGEYSLWMYDVGRDVATRFTFGDRSATQWGGVWSPDGKRVAFASNRQEPSRWDIYIKDASGSQQERMVYKGTWNTPVDWSPDGRYISLVMTSQNAKMDVWLLDLEGEPKVRPLVTTRGADFGARFSRDGKWFSYHSDESGRFESYLASLAEPSVRWQISNNGGNMGYFCQGKQMVYEASDYKMVSVDVDLSGPEPKIGQSRPAFPSMDMSDSGYYEISDDCKRVLANTSVRQSTPRVTLTTNWTSKLKK